MVIRKARLNDAPFLARVRVDAWRETYRGLLPDAYLDAMSYTEAEDLWDNRLAAGDRQGYTLVFENEHGDLGGFVVGGPDRGISPIYQGEIYALYLLKAHQRKGIGKQLVQTMVQQLLERGMNSMQIWVLEQNPARKFYEALGGQAVSEKQLTILNQHYREIGYGWKDIHFLAE